MPLSHSARHQKGHGFPSTQWTLVHRARMAGPEAGKAVGELCHHYWFPIYAFLRRRGQTQHDAEDLTQGFFEKLLEDGLFQSARQEKGRLRSLLLAALQHFVADRRDHDRALKRGGGTNHLSIELERAEERYGAEPVDHRDPEKIYLATWAQSLIERARQKLRESYGAKAELYTALEPFLDDSDKTERYREAAQRLGLNEATARVHVFRLRKRFAQALTEEIEQTVESPEEAAEELAWLKGVLAQ